MEEADVHFHVEADEFCIQLTPDYKQEGLLGKQVYRNETLASQSQPRSQVTGAESKAYRLVVRPRPPLYGLYNNSPATLIVLDFSFQHRLAQSKARFKRAEICLTVEDEATLHINMNEGLIDQTNQPVILRHEPVLIQGPLSEITGEITRAVNAGVSDPTNTASIGVSLSYTTEFIRESKFKIHGTRQGDEIVNWVLTEDEIRKNALPPEVPLGVIVQCTPERKFAVTVMVKAEVRRSIYSVTPVAGEGDDPLFFTHTNPKSNVDLGAELDKLKMFWLTK